MSTQSHTNQQQDGERPRSATSQPDAQQPPGPRRVRRGVHVSTVVSLALGILWLLVSLSLVGSLRTIPGFEPWDWGVLVGWLLSGAATLWRGSEDVLVRVLGGLYRPTHDEQQRLDATWGAVAQAAGIERTRYSLWVEQAEYINALATGCRAVAVTRKTRGRPIRHPQGSAADSLRLAVTALAGRCVVGGVFINYMGEDSHSYGVLLYLELSRQFGEDLVFLDCESIPAGADFVEELLGRLRECRVLLAVIGPRWLTATDPAGNRRIDNPA